MKYAESLESTKDREGVAWVTESNSSLLRALQTSQVLHISTYAQMFYNIINAAVNLKFYYYNYSVRSKQCATMSSWLFAVFIFLIFFKLRESLQRSLKITFKKVLESILSRKTFNSAKNSSWTKKFDLEWFAHAIPRADDNNDVCLLSVNKLKRKCFSLANITKHMENGSSCTVKLWTYLGGLLSSQELGEVLVC